MPICIFFFAVLSERKIDFVIGSKSNLPRNRTRVKYCGMHLLLYLEIIYREALSSDLDQFNLNLLGPILE